MNLAKRLAETDNRPAGFDYLRICLAAAVVVSHAPLVCYGWEFHRLWVASPFVRPWIFFIVPAFFALSGFLVAGSLERNTLPKFLMLRGVRIFPALGVEILLSALLIGPIVTSLSWSEYFSNQLFYRYFLNVIGHVQFYLPGVFGTNPTPDYVNLQLWTVPRELECYILISVVALVGLYRRPKLLFSALVAACALIVLYQQIFHGYLEHDGQARGALPVLCFLCGVCLFALRTVVPFSPGLFVFSLLATIICLSFSDFTFVAPFPIAYATIFMGLQDPSKTSIVRGADYSYGVYLYGFPVQQLLVWAIPWSRIWYVNVALALFITGLCAFLSWHLIERPLHERRSKATALADRLFRRRSAPPTSPAANYRSSS